MNKARGCNPSFGSRSRPSTTPKTCTLKQKTAINSPHFAPSRAPPLSTKTRWRGSHSQTRKHSRSSVRNSSRKKRRSYSCGCKCWATYSSRRKIVCAAIYSRNAIWKWGPSLGTPCSGRGSKAQGLPSRLSQMWWRIKCHKRNRSLRRTSKFKTNNET